MILESTTYPGTTREHLVPILEEHSELRVGRDMNVAFSPERVDPGRTDYYAAEHPEGYRRHDGCVLGARGRNLRAHL